MSPLLHTMFAVLLTGAPILLAQNPCDLLPQAEADSVLGGASTKLPVGRLGCSYSIRDKGVRLTLSLFEVGTSAKQTWEGMKLKVKTAGWLVGDEPGMGSMAYAELIQRSAKSPSGRCGFAAVKGGKILQIYMTDSVGKADLAGTRQALDKLRPIARSVVSRS